MAPKKAKKTTKPKVRKLKAAVANQTIADINGLIKRQEKLDVELKRIKRNIKKLLGHQYFA
jgi:hypothetical protein